MADEPNIDPRKPNSVALARFFKIANERHKIYLRREKGGPPPWTNDPIFRKHRFCNVYRELDRVTVWLRENWREPYKDHHNLVFAMAVARLINWPDTLEAIGFPKRWRPQHVYDVLVDRMERGEKVFTSAYLLGGGCPLGMSRAEYLVDQVLDPIYKNPVVIEKGMSLRDTWEKFRKYQGVGPFLAYEIVTDLRHTKYLRDATDIYAWANPGPGAIRGLCRLYAIPLQGRRKLTPGWRQQMPNERQAMRYLLDISPSYLGKHMSRWEMREVEHWLCEFDKYSRVMDGGRFDLFRPNEGRDSQGTLL